MSHTFTVRSSLDVEGMKGQGIIERSYSIPFPAGRVIRDPRRAQTLVSVEAQAIASTLDGWAHNDFTLVVKEVRANGLQLLYKKGHAASVHRVQVNIVVHDAGAAEAAEKEASELRAKVYELENRQAQMQARFGQVLTILVNLSSQFKNLMP